MKTISGYSKEEIKRFRELYKQGYSATLIREMIGRPLKTRYINTKGVPMPDSQYATQWLAKMRKRLKLKKRGVGFRGIRWEQVHKNMKFERADREGRLQELKLKVQSIDKVIAKW